MYPRLVGVEAKLRRAQELLDLEDGEWGAWIAREEPWTTEPELLVSAEGARCCVMCFRVLKPIPARFSVIVGEIVHNTRTALDHLAAYLVECCGAQPTSETAWPIETSLAGWRRNVERRGQPLQLWRKDGSGPLAGIPVGSAAWRLVERAQPCLRDHDRPAQALANLDRLWRTDRRRIVDASPIYADPEVVLNAFTFPIEPIAREILITPDTALIDGTKLASFHFERPLSPEVEVKTRLPVQVALGDDRNGRAGHLRETVEVVHGLMSAAEALGSSYRPRFAAPRVPRQPPTVRA